MAHHAVWHNIVYTSVKRLLMVCALLVVCVAVGGSRTPTDLENIRSKGYLTVASRNGPTTYYEGPYGYTGYDYALTAEFAKYLGVKLKIIEKENLDDLLHSVNGTQVDLVAAGITITQQRAKKVDFSNGFYEVTQQVIYRRGEPKPTSPEDFVGKKVLVIANSSHSETLRRLQADNPAIQWEEDPRADMLELLEMVHQGRIDYTIVDSNAYAMNQNVFPKARIAFDISAPEPLGWAFRKQADKSLQKAANQFLREKTEDGTLERIAKNFYKPAETVNLSGALLYAKRIESRLPKWEAHFRSAAEANEIDWQLLAALSYQESHWNHRARSHTGVRGLMMLTLTTAKELGVNRLDPEQAIEGGANYFKKIYDRIPDSVQGPDRTWLALAAYNVGYGHMEDARVLTEKMGGNPNKWKDVKEHLPLLAKRTYYRDAKHGYARGWEPVKYVQSIRHFYNILAWNNEIKARRLAAANETEHSVRAVNYQQATSAISNTRSLL